MSCGIHTQVAGLVTADAILTLQTRHSAQCRKHLKYENSTQLYVCAVCQTLYLHVQQLYLEEFECPVLGHEHYTSVHVWACYMPCSACIRKSYV